MLVLLNSLLSLYLMHKGLGCRIWCDIKDPIYRGLLKPGLSKYADKYCTQHENTNTAINLSVLL
jgi:hypothetical protein